MVTAAFIARAFKWAEEASQSTPRSRRRRSKRGQRGDRARQMRNASRREMARLVEERIEQAEQVGRRGAQVAGPRSPAAARTPVRNSLVPKAAHSRKPETPAAKGRRRL